MFWGVTTPQTAPPLKSAPDHMLPKLYLASGGYEPKVPFVHPYKCA